MIDTFVIGWNAADANTLATAFTADADFTAITGLHARGRDFIARGHDEILSGIYRGTVLEAKIESLHYLRPDVALLDVKFMLRKEGSSFFPGVTHTSAGIVATRDDDAWRIAVFRNMVPYSRPIAGPVELELRQATPA